MKLVTMGASAVSATAAEPSSACSGPGMVSSHVTPGARLSLAGTELSKKNIENLQVHKHKV